MLATVHLDGRRRLAACAVAGAAALLLGISGVAARGGAPAGDHSRGAALEHVTTDVQPVHRPHDDRGNGDDLVAEPDEHGDPRRLRIAVATPGPTPTPHGPRLGDSGGSTPTPAPVPPVTGTTGTGPTATRTTPTTTAPTRNARPAGTVPPPSTPPRQPTPRVTLPPLVLIPPLGLPTPPTLNVVTGGIGVVPLVVLLLAMGALAVTLGLRLVRRSR